MARCPAHHDREPSLAIAEGKGGNVLVHCHAGCDQLDVIAALKARGAWGTTRQSEHPLFYKAGRQSPAELDRDSLKRTEGALAVWRTSRPGHAGLKHPSGGVWPSMVALVRHGGNGNPIGIHRTFLAHDGNGKAPVEPAKMMLGPCRGGTVRLGPAANVQMVGEGIETCLAAIQASRQSAWASLSTSGLRALDLPRELRDVIVLADGDDPGEAAAQDCASRWRREGRRVRIARPPRGMDFNDLLITQIRQNDEVTP
jgi:hypothetical protein